MAGGLFYARKRKERTPSLGVRSLVRGKRASAWVTAVPEPATSLTLQTRTYTFASACVSARPEPATSLTLQARTYTFASPCVTARPQPATARRNPPAPADG